MNLKDNCFIQFNESISHIKIPEKLCLIANNKPHELCLMASKQLQIYLNTQNDWLHNFGLNTDNDKVIIGKMFGVLVIQNSQNEGGFLAAFSGKLANSNQHNYFVPPVFDSLTQNSFLNLGMIELANIIEQIATLSNSSPIENKEKIILLKQKRKNHSIALQQKLFDHYEFINISKNIKTAHEIYKDANYKNPPAGGGECATPKLLQYAFQHNLKPIALAEFWWGQSPKSTFWKHGEFYACCKDKCAPILAHMLQDIPHEYL